jgi:SecD/SecF fusion protein
VFTILLTLACLYQLSFSWVTSGVENEADAYGESQAAMYQDGDTSIVEVANGKFPVSSAIERSVYAKAVTENFLVEKGNESVYPLLGHSYKECKDNELAKGLDLEGGMSVTLQVSIPDMVRELAGRYSKRAEFSEPFNAANAVFKS